MNLVAQNYDVLGVELGRPLHVLPRSYTGIVLLDIRSREQGIFLSLSYLIERIQVPTRPQFLQDGELEKIIVCIYV